MDVFAKYISQRHNVYNPIGPGNRGSRSICITMEQNLRSIPSAGRISSVDVHQLDKINAIPNKTSDTVLTDGLCQEDRLFLTALMDDDSAESDDDETATSRCNNSTWSPMAQRRSMKIHKRIKRLRPSYAVTLSLEDISYIRPSWVSIEN